MSNQRKAGKRKAGVWLSPKEWNDLESAAKSLGISKSDLLKLAINDGMKTAILKRGTQNVKD